MDALTNHIQGEVPWCMLFADDIVLIDEMQDGVNERKVPPELKGKFYTSVVRLAKLYGVECWPVKNSHIQKMKVTEMRMLRWMCGHTWLDKITNEDIQIKVVVTLMEEKMREARFRWFGHAHRRSLDGPVKRCEWLALTGMRRGRRRPKKYWREVIRQDIVQLQISKDMIGHSCPDIVILYSRGSEGNGGRRGTLDEGP
ncbi:uncharacterized protein [Nicotiana sylvestris]|uniref:uncharacterized protein n=1 Tax=Nicotiana sylvestris TaxID=4096 RepID=UPI00388C9FC7